MELILKSASVDLPQSLRPHSRLMLSKPSRCRSRTRRLFSRRQASRIFSDSKGLVIDE